MGAILSDAAARAERRSKRNQMQRQKRILGACPNCREKSVVRKCYATKNDLTLIKRIEFCINKNKFCGYKLDLPPIKKESEG